MTRPPRIGLSVSLLPTDRDRTVYDGRELVYAERSMTDWLLAAGVAAYLLPPLGARPSSLDYAAIIEPLDALVLQGGIDISPTVYGQRPRRPEWAGNRERDDYEIGLLRAAMDLNRPVLGICRGHQLINVALGGTLVQDIDSELPGALQHRNAELYERNHHDVDFAPGSLLQRAYSVSRATVNSVHHQAVAELAPGLVVEARSVEDDVVEAIRLEGESSSDPWVLGVQWHLEFQDPSDERLLPTSPLVDALFAAIHARAGHAE